MRNVISRIWADMKKYVWLGVFLAVYYVAVHTLLPVACPLILTTGFPCAGCGMTRAVLFVLTGQFSRAFYLNPLAFVVVLFGMYCCFYRYVLGKPVRGFVKGILVICILLFLAYGVRMYFYFPDRIPYVYTHRNLLEQRVPGYGELARKICSYFSGI